MSEKAAMHPHEAVDWCHLCGRRSDQTVDVWYPADAEHDPAAQPGPPHAARRYLRVCAPCGRRIADTARPAVPAPRPAPTRENSAPNSSDAEPLMPAAPWRVALDFGGGQTRYEIVSHVAPAVVLDSRYWADGDTGPTDAFGHFLHDEHADVMAYRVRVGWVIAAAPHMRAALQDLLAADTPEWVDAAREKARDALALAALPVGVPEPPAGYLIDVADLTPRAGEPSVDPASMPNVVTVAEAVAHMAEFDARKFTLSVLALGRSGGEGMFCEWDADAGAWSPWRSVDGGGAS